jgi:hypothetical protein
MGSMDRVMPDALEKRPRIEREAEKLSTEYDGLRFEISEYDPVHRTHYLRVLRDGGVVHLDRLELVSSRARSSVVRAFDASRRVSVDRILQHLHEAHRHLLPEIMAELVPVIVNGEDVKPEPVRWLWEDRVPRGKLVNFEGDPGLGKSLASLDLAARLSSGSPMPDGTPNAFDGHPVATVVLSAEDDPADTILPRFIAAGGDPRYLRLLRGVVGPDGERIPNLGDVAAIRRALISTGARLLIIDPLAAYVPAQSDAWRDDAIRRLLLPISQLVAELDVGLVCIRNLTKDNRRPAIYRGQASIGIAGAARAVFVFAKDPSDRTGERRCVATVKFNIGKEPPTLAYHIVSERGERAHIRWQKGIVSLTADELLAPQVSREAHDDDDSALDEACSVLSTILEDGPVETSHVYRQATQAGIKRRTLERAKVKAGVRSVKDGPGEDGQQAWRWHRASSTPTSPSVHTPDVGDVGDVGDLHYEPAPNGTHGDVRQGLASISKTLKSKIAKSSGFGDLAFENESPRESSAENGAPISRTPRSPRSPSFSVSALGDVAFENESELPFR